VSTAFGPQPLRLSANDFFLGLFAALRLRGQTAFSVRDDRFDAVIKDVYESLSHRAIVANIDVRFRIRPHPIYGDSTTVRKALTAAAQRRIISFDNPEYLDIRIQMDEAEAHRKLLSLHAPDGLFDELATEFLAKYRDRRVSVPQPSPRA